MRLKITLTSGQPVVMPVSYQALIQALIYNHLEKEEAAWLHDQGFAYENRRFKLFVFSAILENGDFREKDKTLLFPTTISFIVSSPVDWILKQLAENFIMSEQVRLGQCEFIVNSVEILQSPVFESNSIIVKALTPIEVHSTFETATGKKKTHFYSPFESDFSDLINKNIKKKWQSFTSEECPYDLAIKPLFSDKNNEKVRYFGNGPNKTLVKGWLGRFRLKGESELLRFACDAGLGSRNSMGFGMVEIVG